jgi:hypothetical protein
MFSKKDLKQFRDLGIEKELIEEQLENFRIGFPFLEVIRAATVKSGITRLEEEEIIKYIGIFETETYGKKILKFVPASGAATRMFKTLFEFLKNYSGSEEDYLKLLTDQGPDSVYYTFENIDYFAFFDELKNLLRERGFEIDDLRKRNEFLTIVNTLLFEDGLNYSNLPKGLIAFHKYKEGPRTPVEEHLVEAVQYCKTNDGKVFIHFTVSPEHKKAFKKHTGEARKKFGEIYGVQFVISLSEQKQSTDIIAVDSENKPFRNSDGSILFRPGGHGALIENLDEIDADIIFIKNIDNIAPDSLKAKTFVYKKALAGLLFKYQEKIFEHLEMLDSPKDVDEKTLEKIYRFVEKDLCTIPPPNLSNAGKNKTIEWLKKKLNRPLRVCGIVRNEGEPGGGPFWTRTADGTVSLQIVEASQINLNDPDYNEIFQSSTHFNPVDLVCAVKNYKGEKFDLHQFIDKKTGFISEKSKDGKKLKAQELPGLWNGAMSDWNTIFVEVPIETFSPVKVINDLLRVQHQV